MAEQESDVSDNKLHDGKTRNTIEEHSAVVKSHQKENDDTVLDFKNVSDNETPKNTKEKLKSNVSKDEKKLSDIEKKLEKAESKLPSEKVITLKKQQSQKNGKSRRKLKLEDRVKTTDKKLLIRKGAQKVNQHVGTTVSGVVHNQISKDEDDSSALQTGHFTEKIGEHALHSAESALKTTKNNIKTAPYRKVSKLKFQRDKTEKKLTYHKAILENSKLCSDKKAAVKMAMKKSQQKQNQVKAAKETVKVTEKVGHVVEKAGKKIVTTVASNKCAIIVVIIFLIVLTIFGTICSSCCASFADTEMTRLATSYTAKEEDIYAANNHMINLENGLSDYLNHIPDYYVGWSEYNYHLDGIGHDPYNLISYLSAMKIAFKFDSDTENKINQIYNELYQVNIVSTDEVRSYTYTETDINGNLVEVTVFYDYYILDVTLTTKDFDSIVRPNLESAGVYDLYVVMLENKGNKPYLF